MKRKLLHPLSFLTVGLSILVSTTAAHGQDASPWMPNLEAKIRGGYAPHQGDHLNMGSLSYGLNFSWSLPKGRLGVELGYFYKNGDLNAGTIQSANPTLLAVDPKNSVEQKRNDLKGFSARFAWENGFELPWGLEPRVGIMLGGTTSRQEYAGDVRSQSWGTGTAGAWRDTFSGTPVQGGLNPSPFLGVNVPLNRDNALEIQVLLLNYQAIDHVHAPGYATAYPILNDNSGSPVGPLAAHNDTPKDTLQKTRRGTPHLEIGWTIRF